MYRRLIPEAGYFRTHNRYCLRRQLKNPPLSCVTDLLNLVATSGPAALLSASSKGVSSTTIASGPSIVQLTVSGRSPDHEQGRVNSAAVSDSQRTKCFRTVTTMPPLLGSTSEKKYIGASGNFLTRLSPAWLPLKAICVASHQVYLQFSAEGLSWRGQGKALA